MPKDTFFYPKATINCRGRLLDLTTPKVMGIVNLTPDSFYDGRTKNSAKQILKSIEKMIEHGVDIVDIGGYSSKPDAIHISEEEEIERIIPIIKLVYKTFPSLIMSIDTFRSQVAQMALNNGVSIVNDISAGEIDNKMTEIVAAEKNVPYVIMHMIGTPQTMQLNPKYENITKEISSYFSLKLNKLEKLGIKDLIIDPGFGFGKKINDNYELLEGLDQLSILKRPILVGVSRKSMIYKQLNSTPKEALNGTTALNMTSLLKGSNILRVHDVKEAKETISLFLSLQK